MTAQVAPDDKQVASSHGLGIYRISRWWLAVGFGALLLVYLIVSRIESTVSHWPPTIREAVAPSHCEQFITLAKAAYGDDWRVRLDPRDATCANEITAQWQQQWLPRNLPSPEPAYILPPQAVAVPTMTAEAHAAGTYCLNVISLAKVRYGADWRTKIDPAAGKSCESQIATIGP